MLLLKWMNVLLWEKVGLLQFTGMPTTIIFQLPLLLPLPYLLFAKCYLDLIIISSPSPIGYSNQHIEALLPY
jgi:hypothetical protein